MEALMAGVIGVLIAGGVFLLLRARTFPIILGLLLLGYAVNLFLLATGRLGADAPPIITPGATHHADPLPQALILTSIVISFGMVAFVVVLALRNAIASDAGEKSGAGEADDGTSGDERLERSGST